MVLGVRIRERRKALKLNQDALGELVGVARQTISSWENGAFEPDGKNLGRLATALQTSVWYLMGGGDDPSPPTETSPPVRLDTNEKMKIPVISMRTPACAGDGNGLDCLELEAEETYLIDRDAFNTIDEFHKPFGVYVDGDSMEEQGIFDGEIAIINPAEDVMEGDIALVSYKGQWSIKGIEFLPDGSIHLRAGKPQYERVVPAEMVEDGYWFKTIGKVVFVQPPRRRPKRFV